MSLSCRDKTINTSQCNGYAKVAAGLALGACCFANSAAYAGAALFSTTNIQYLYGTKYKLGDESRSIMTVEHFDAWKYGDNFFFVDVTNPARDDVDTPTQFYAEFSPRLSLSSITGQKLSYGVIKDALISTTIEMGQGFHTNLYGLAVDLDIPNVPVAQINYYIRNEVTSGSDLGSQLTLVWLAPFNLGPASFSFEGFLDYAFGNDPAEDNIVSGPRLLLDVGKFFDAPGQVQVGTEVQIWRNKFGIKDVNETCPQAMVKWIW